jgi:Delta14-sterol reductase
MSLAARRSCAFETQAFAANSFASIGATAITLGLPLVCYLTAFLCNDISGCPAPSLLHPSTFTLDKLKQEIGWPADGVLGLASYKVTGWLLGYYLLSLVLQAFLPGEEVMGGLLQSGARLKYKFNGMGFPSLPNVICAI